METMQFSAVVVLTLLSMKLLLLPRRAAENAVASKARWLMVCGTSLLALQFLLQYVLKLRAMGVTQAVMLNLALFIPSSTLLSLAVLYLQRQGKISQLERWIGVPVWIVAMTMIAVSTYAGGKPLLAGAREVRWAEWGASLCYAGIQFFYTYRHLRELRRMRQALQDYYDRDMDGILRWMQVSVVVLAFLAVLAPLFIFGSGSWLAIYGIFSFMGIFYLVDSFCSYVVSSAPAKMKEAEEEEQENESVRERSEKTSATENRTGIERKRIEAPGSTKSENSPCDGQKEDEEEEREAMLRVDTAVEAWLNRGGHMKDGIKMPNTADDMGVPRYLLALWLRKQGLKYSEWMTRLRIEEAKRTLKAHPDWSNEAVAQHCGFHDRSYFQTLFKRMTGFTPAQFVAQP